jgi:hypothetical protein
MIHPLPVIPAKAGTHGSNTHGSANFARAVLWVPAFAGMTKLHLSVLTQEAN